MAKKTLVKIHLVTSNSTPAEYKIFWMKKSENMLVWLSKLVLVQHFVAAKRYSKA
jgi:hypothetical protein